MCEGQRSSSRKGKGHVRCWALTSQV